MNSELKPKIRFKGFTDDWEQRKLGELIRKPVTDGPHETPNLLESGIPFLSIEAIHDGIIDISKCRGYISKEEDKKYKLKYEPEIGDVFFTKAATIGRVAIVRKLGFNIWSPIGAIKPDFTKTTSEYLFYILQTKDIMEQAILGSNNSSQYNLSMITIENFVFMIPKTIEEQNKISILLKNIDNLITLHQRKCDKLVELKKSLLEKMFPQNNSVIPEIRFKGFSNDWEQRKFENIYNYERPDKYIVNSTEYLEFGPTPVLTANKAFILGYTTENNKYVNSKESIIFDDFTMDTKFVDFPYMVKSSAIKILTLKDEKKDNIRFNFELLSNHRFNILGHARHYISVVQPEEVFTTNKQEQDKIGELFTNIDNLITLHQCKYDKLNKIRQSLLNDMFI